MNLEQTLRIQAMLADVRTICGFKIIIETKKGEVRRGADKHGRPWAVRMPFDYGFIHGTEGMDGDCVDVLLGPLKNPKVAWVVGMPKAHGNEDKVMLGFASKDKAIQAFLRCYQGKKKFLGHVSEMTIDKLKKRLATRRGMRLSASGWESNPWANMAYQGFDPIPPRNTVPVENEGYDEDDPLDALMRKDPDNIKYYTELARRLGAKTIAETALIENFPYGGTDGRP